MKIQIITYYCEASNYGAFYQALALYEYMSHLGHQVAFYGDYEIEKTCIVNQDPSHKSAKIRNAQKKYFRVDYNRNTVYDLALIGSDQVWGGEEPCFWGKEVNAKYLASYAPSVGNLVTSKIIWKSVIKSIMGRISFYKHRDDLMRFDAISVRDKLTGELVKETLHTKPSTVLDPTFLIDWNPYISTEVTSVSGFPMPGKYIMIYSYGFDNITEKQISDFAKSENLQTVAVNYDSNIFDISRGFTPEEVLYGFKNAKYVITDSFHGSVFSIIFGKQFVTIGKGRDSKGFMLLEQFGIPERFVKDAKDAISTIQKDIDYQIINEKINVFRGNSISFLNQCIQEAESR